MESQTLLSSSGTTEPLKEPSSKKRISTSWNEYLVQALLIVFSVLLALSLNEWMHSYQEHQHTRKLLSNIQDELRHNQTIVEQQYHYHLQILHSIDSALTHEAYRKQIIQNDEFNLQVIAPEGVLYGGGLDDTAWEVAKNNNISSRIDVETFTLLTKIAIEQQKINKVEDEIAAIILSREARQEDNARQTLILIRDTYRGWAVDRVPGLLKRYEQTLAQINNLL